MLKSIITHKKKWNKSCKTYFRNVLQGIFFVDVQDTLNMKGLFSVERS